MIRRFLPVHFGNRAVAAAVAMVCFSAVPALAQGRPAPIKPPITVLKGKMVLPSGFAPPTGMCRIWIHGVPADQQPAPTDCATAVKNRPLNGRVIFSEEKSKGTRPHKAKHEEDPSF